MATMYIGLEGGIGLGALFSAYIYDNNPANFDVTFWASAIVAGVALGYLLVLRKLRGVLALPEDAL